MWLLCLPRSYGRRLDRLIDAVAVLSHHLDPTTDLAPKEQAALDKLIKLRDHLDAAKRQA